MFSWSWWILLYNFQAIVISFLYHVQDIKNAHIEKYLSLCIAIRNLESHLQKIKYKFILLTSNSISFIHIFYQGKT